MEHPFNPEQEAETFLERAIFRLDESIMHEAQIIRTTYSDLPADYNAILSTRPFPQELARNLLTNIDQAMERLERIDLHLSHMRTVDTLLNGWALNIFDYNPASDPESIYSRALKMVSPNLEKKRAELGEVRGNLALRIAIEDKS
ncbi:MAG: hypothetical protein AABW79_04945 [Nanoarchaeota archaeon]